MATPESLKLSLDATAKVGRFELKHVLGKGAQASVWLAWDSRLDREVAVKLMHAETEADAGSVNQWLQEARSVSRLTHPNIVPVFEADVHAGQPYLVFEYVAGPTLTQHLKNRGALTAHEAASLMLGVLDALHTAHLAGVVHRDLKPSNILVDATGRARVMDFGIAARMNDRSGQGEVVGTPGYMSPEAAGGALPAATMDVFAAGVMLVEMLSGQRLVAERDPFRALARVMNEDLVLPAGLAADADEALRSILLRAIARDPAQRWPSAALLRDALAEWLTPPAAAAVPTPQMRGGSASQGAGTLDFLMRRMRHKSDFPALSDSVLRIRRVTSSETESLTSLSNEILKDVALTNKLLRVVNSAFFAAAGGSVSTVSRAVALIGFAGIRNMAMSLVLLEHMTDKAHAGQLQDEFLRALMAGILASELGRDSREGEEAFIAAMFQNLGRLLTEYYLAEEAQQVRALLSAGAAPGRTAVTEESASTAVLGLGYEQLGIGVAKSWGLPDSLQRCMRKPVGAPPSHVPGTSGERLRWLSRAANGITDTLMASEPHLAATRVTHVAHQYAGAIGASVAQIEAATQLARERIVELAQAMSLSIGAGSPAKRLLAPVKAASATAATVTATATATAMATAAATATATVASPAASSAAEASPITITFSTLKAHAFEATVTSAPAAPPTPLENTAELLAAGIQDITNAMVEDFKLNEVLRMVLETMFRALGLRTVVFCLRDPKTGVLTGRFGLGDDAKAIAASFKITLQGATDLFAAVCTKGSDILIKDASTPAIATRLPAWYRQHVNAPAFLLLPLLVKGAPFGLIYADKAQAGGIELGEKELSLVRTLRNQAVMAFKQSA